MANAQANAKMPKIFIVQTEEIKQKKSYHLLRGAVLRQCTQVQHVVRGKGKQSIVGNVHSGAQYGPRNVD